ncbi:CerR family C-terminal domain-containing protein [Janthinobacterium agaricidamnosum]|uniref:Bacterial regulatory s, tetR family protein n=1 Tax=Janthinobacterium agaricidamnosum NBRC 102515 = DSM 9628 TaxID=1349767 RepID=W0V237_9BURK|nr:CerR family C-terminal domain-containing protein [Janthinobacterium agaricidamnosum]CDG81685.1 bacterial regulatory s, tetR family protein [Janthinobacterium agaricidamnosum NBRC 102515 = DSM 9628]
MTEKAPPKPERTEDSRKPRSDGEQSRERLLLSAIRLFGEQGYAKTSTREIALSAGTNVAAISYYFGDKAGLYRSCFKHQSNNPQQAIAALAQPDLPLREALHIFFGKVVFYMHQGDLTQLRVRLWLRELLEPTGLWQNEIQRGIKPVHLALVDMVSRHVGISPPNDDMHRLAFAIVGMGWKAMATRDVVESIRPQLLATPQAVERWAASLVDYAEAIIAVEKNRLQRKTA